MPTSLPRWFLSALRPGLALANRFSRWRFWAQAEPQSDGILYFRFAAKTWDRPLEIEHFWAGWNHQESYVSMGRSWTRVSPGDRAPIAGLRIIQLVLFASAIVAFSIVCHRVFLGDRDFSGGRCLLDHARPSRLLRRRALTSPRLRSSSSTWRQCVRGGSWSRLCSARRSPSAETSFSIDAVKPPPRLVVQHAAFRTVGERPEQLSSSAAARRRFGPLAHRNEGEL